MPRSGNRMRVARTALLICAVSAGPDDADDVAPNAGGGAELEERCCTVETTMRRMLIRNRRLICKGKSTELRKSSCTWFGEVCLCCSLTPLPGPAWVLLKYVLQRLFLSSVYLEQVG